MPFLLQPSHFILAWDRHQMCWIVYPVAWFVGNRKAKEIEKCKKTVQHGWALVSRHGWVWQRRLSIVSADSDGVGVPLRCQRPRRLSSDWMISGEHPSTQHYCTSNPGGFRVNWLSHVHLVEWKLCQETNYHMSHEHPAVFCWQNLALPNFSIKCSNCHLLSQKIVKQNLYAQSSVGVDLC